MPTDNSDKIYTGRAARILADRILINWPRYGNPFPFEMLFAFLLSALQMCRLQPPDAYDALTWRPYRVFDWFGWRLDSHRRNIEGQLRRAFEGGGEEFRATMAAMWAAVDAGEVSREMVVYCYREAGK